MAKKVAASRKKAKTTNVRVKRTGEVVATLQRQIAYNLHGRYDLSLSKSTQNKLVAYGPWLAAILIIIILPELMVLAKTGNLMSFSGFFNEIFFNQAAWIVLLILFVNILLLVDGLGHLFLKKQRGWNRVYLASLVSTGYIIWQLFSQMNQPAAPILSLVAVGFILFSLLDINKYYK